MHLVSWWSDGADFAHLDCALFNVWDLSWENWADSDPSSLLFSSRLAWACPHGRSQGLQGSRSSMQSLLRPRFQTPLTLVKESHVASADCRSGGIIPPLNWRGSKVMLQRGMHAKRGMVVGIFYRSSVHGARCRPF